MPPWTQRQEMLWGGQFHEMQPVTFEFAPCSADCLAQAQIYPDYMSPRPPCSCSEGFITSGLRQLDILQPSAGPDPGGSCVSEPQFLALPDLGLAGTGLTQAQAVPWPALLLLKQVHSSADPHSGNPGSLCSACTCRSGKAWGCSGAVEMLCLGPGSRQSVACCWDTARGGFPPQSGWFASSRCLRTHRLRLVPSPGEPTPLPLLAACSHASLSTFSKGPETRPTPCGGDSHRTDPLLVAEVYKILV